MKVTDLEMRQEAIERMRLMGLADDVVDAYETDESVSRIGVWRDSVKPPVEPLRAIIGEIERKYDLKVYLALGSYVMGFAMESLLYVSRDDEDWEYCF